MADKDERWEDNVAGKFYVDKECILCSLCTDLAPENFAESEDGDHDYVMKQPEGADEQAACLDAMEQCPVDSIGNDG